MKKKVSDHETQETKGDSPTKPESSPLPGRSAEDDRGLPRESIFDATYAPEASELRKAWSRFSRNKR